MDFKILLIIFVLFIGILYIIKEVITLKKETIKISNLIDNSLNNNIKGLKNRLNVVASEIKNYNNDLVIQIKKINSINSQVITSMSNYYTESESDGNKNLIDYLSDAKRTDTEFKINFNESDKKETQIKKSYEKEHVTEHSKTSTTKSILPSIQIQVNDKSSKTSDQTSVKSSKSNINNQNECLVIGDITNTNITNITNNIEANEKTEETKETEETETEEEIIEEIIEEIEVTDTNTTESDKSNVSSKSESIKLDNITIGSTSTNKGKKLEINDTNSIETNNILTMTKLNPINKYTKQNLERIAKVLSIPITYNENNIRKPYKKDELYSKIRDFLLSNLKVKHA
jgi:hypothetical protein